MTTLPENVGILAIEVYFPSTCVKQENLEEFDGVSKGKYTIGLGQEVMGFCYDNEDINSICLTVVSLLMKKHNIKYEEIGRLEVGTETLVDKSKSVKSVLMQLFGECTDVEGVDLKNACYGGTAALFNSIAWVESSSWDGRYALCVCGDIAVYSQGPARCTGGAGAIALLIGPGAPLIMDPGVRSSYMSHAYDFYKPDMTSEYPVVDGKLSVASYITALNSCYDGYCKKATDKLRNGSLSEVSLATLDYVVFHCPYTKLVRKSLARLVLNDFVNNRTKNYSGKDKEGLEQLEQYRDISLTDTIFNREVEQASIRASEHMFSQTSAMSLTISKLVGNMYTPSLYNCLVSVLINRSINELHGKRIALFSYGSGLASTMFSLQVCGDKHPQQVKQLQNLLAGLSNVQDRLSSRCEVGPEEFTKALELREICNETKKNYVCKCGPDKLFPGTFYLTAIDEKYRRSYMQKSTEDIPFEGSVPHKQTVNMINGY